MKDYTHLHPWGCRGKNQAFLKLVLHNGKTFHCMCGRFSKHGLPKTLSKHGFNEESPWKSVIHFSVFKPFLGNP